MIFSHIVKKLWLNLKMLLTVSHLFLYVILNSCWLPPNHDQS